MGSQAKRPSVNGRATKRKIRRMQKTRRRIAADVADQRSARKKNVKHMCSKPNHFRTNRQKNKTAHIGHKRVQQVTKETNKSEEEAIDIENPLFKIKAVSSVKTPGKQFNAMIIFSDPEELCLLSVRHRRYVQCWLRDFPVVNQTGNPPLRSSKVKLKLFDGSLVKPYGVTTLKIHQNNTTKELDFQIVEKTNKPLLLH